jgi:hypothetical protein
MSAGTHGLDESRRRRLAQLRAARCRLAARASVVDRVARLVGEGADRARGVALRGAATAILASNARRDPITIGSA